LIEGKEKVDNFSRQIQGGEMRGGMKVLVQLVVAAGILVGLCSYGHGEEHSASAEAILRKTAKAYETLRTYQDETTLVVHVTAQGTQQRTETRYSLAVERPNKLALVFKSGSTGITLVSDGKGLYTYLAMLGQYTVEKAREVSGSFSKAASRWGKL
jgi:outer membrane lipoprotein-sorting protein